MRLETRFARLGRDRIAYQTLGEGPLVLVNAPGSFSHADVVVEDPAAMLYYRGGNEKIRRNIIRLQSAMAIAGFYGLRTEWWHFTEPKWQTYLPAEEAKRAMQAFSQAEKEQRKL